MKHDVCYLRRARMHMHSTHVHVLASTFTLCRDEESVHHVCMRVYAYAHGGVLFIYTLILFLICMQAQVMYGCS